MLRVQRWIGSDGRHILRDGRLGSVFVARIPGELIKLQRSPEEERPKLAGLDGEERAAQ